MMKNRIAEKLTKTDSLLKKNYGLPQRQSPKPKALDVIVATILSQNTSDKNSYKAYGNLRRLYPEWESLLKAPLSDIQNAVKPAGLWKSKSSAIKNLINGLEKKHGRISLNYLNRKSDTNVLSELTANMGIGIKTAACVLLFAFDRNVCPVDTHIHRVLNRLGIVKTGTPQKTFEIIYENFPEKKIAHSLHSNLIRLGREICRPLNPSCGICPLKEECDFPGRNDLQKKRQKNDFLLLDNV